MVVLGADPPVETSQGDVGMGALPAATTSALIPRPRLLTRLTEEPAEVTLLCAPAGSGKSTLLQALVAAEVPAPVPTAWAALDERDDSVAGLWSTILAALRNADPAPDWSSLPDLRAPSDVVDAGFLDDLAATVEQHDGDVRLILDDLHVLQEPAALQSLDELLLRPPMNLRLVLSTRSEPPLALGRLRLNDRLHELRRDDLAFDGSEVAALLHAEGIEVDPAGAALLRDRTEGWAAGIRLAALLLRTNPDPERCIAEFDGATAAVESYLDSEVLRRQPQDVRGFLLRTSICSELPVELAARLSGRSDAGAVLEQLARRQTFTERVVGRREVYRYHPILRSFLAAVLQGSDPSQEVALHRLAAGWYRDADDPLHALEHLVRAGADTELIELLRAEGLGLVLDGHEVLLDRLLARLPADLADRDEIRLLRHIAALERRATTPDTAPAPADLARLVTSPDRWVATTAAAAARREQLLEDPAEPPRSPTLLPDTATESGDLDLYAAYQHALWWLRTGQLERSTALLEDVGHRAEVLGRDALTLACASHLSVARLMSGALPGARQQAERALEVATQRGWWRTEKAMPAHLVLAWTGYLQADRQLAGRHAGVAGTTTGAATDPRLLQSLDSCSVLIGMEAGPEPHRLLTRYLAGLREEVLAQMTPTYHAHAGPLLVQAALRIGGASAAAEVARSHTRPREAPAEQLLQQALLRHAQGDPAGALAALAPILNGKAKHPVQVTLTAAQLLSADLYLQRGAELRAREALHEALSLARPAELLRPFVDASPAVQELLRDDLARLTRAGGFADRVVRRLGRADHAGAVPTLTPAEARVLRELPSRLTVLDIATLQGVSDNTVKTHLRALYRKLGVSGRREAVEVARRHGLL